MTLVRGSLVALLCMPVFVVGCGAEPGTVGQDVADNPGDMLDDTAVGPSERELQLGTAIVRQFAQLQDLRDPITAVQMFELGDVYELVGAGRDRAPDFGIGSIGRSLLPDCIDVANDTISFTDCAVGPLELDGLFKLNFTTIDVQLGVNAVVGDNEYNTGGNLFAVMSVSDGNLDAGIGMGTYFGSINAAFELQMDNLAIADCGPTIGSITLTLILLDEEFNKVLPFDGCE